MSVVVSVPAGAGLSLGIRDTILTIDAGETSSTTAATAAQQSVTITSADNARANPDRSFTVSVALDTACCSTAAVRPPDGVTLTVSNDDAGVLVTESGGSTRTTEAVESRRTDPFSVCLATRPSTARA